MTLGTRIQEARQKLAMSRADLAARVKVSASYIHDIENDRRLPSESALHYIAVALDVPFELLAPLSGRPTREMQAYLLTHPAMWSLWSAFAEHEVSNEKIEAIMATTGNLKEE